MWTGEVQMLFLRIVESDRFQISFLHLIECGCPNAIGSIEWYWSLFLLFVIVVIQIPSCPCVGGWLRKKEKMMKLIRRKLFDPFWEFYVYILFNKMEKKKRICLWKVRIPHPFLYEEMSHQLILLRNINLRTLGKYLIPNFPQHVFSLWRSLWSPNFLIVPLSISV